MAVSEGWVLTLLVVIGFILLWGKWRWLPSATQRVYPKSSPRPLKPRTPDDCPACRAASQPGRPPASTLLKPYSQVKGPRGRKKRIATAGYACPNSNCRYYGITDEQIHALVGCGGHGRQEYIRDLKCQACQTKFSVRYGTVLYRLKTPSRRVGEVLAVGLRLGLGRHPLPARGGSPLRPGRRPECRRCGAGLRARRIHDPNLAHPCRAACRVTARATIPGSEAPAHPVGRALHQDPPGGRRAVGLPKVPSTRAPRSSPC